MKNTENLGEFQKFIEDDGNRNIHRYFSRQHGMDLSGRIAEYSCKIWAMIFDDSPLEKSGKKIESVIE